MESNLYATRLEDVRLRTVYLDIGGEILLPMTYFCKGVLHKALLSCNFDRQLERNRLTDTQRGKRLTVP